MIDRKKIRKKRPRFSSKRTNGSVRSYNEKTANIPKTRVGISNALEKYTGLAEDAFSNGDRIVAESYFQYAEHYQRLLNETPPEHSKDETVNNRDPSQSREIVSNSNKPSRTQRAENAKEERKIKEEISPESNKSLSNKKRHQAADNSDDVTSDGIEALKPYEI